MGTINQLITGGAPPCSKPKKHQRQLLGPLFLEPKLVTFEVVKTDPLVGILLYPPPTRMFACKPRLMLRTHCGCKAGLLRACCFTWGSSETNNFVTKVCTRFILDEWLHMDRTCAFGSLACSFLGASAAPPPHMVDSTNYSVRTDLIFQLYFWKYKAWHSQGMASRCTLRGHQMQFLLQLWSLPRSGQNGLPTQELSGDLTVQTDVQ